MEYFFSGGSEERINGALNVVNFSIFSSFVNIESYHSYLRGLLTTPPILSGVAGFLVGPISFFIVS